jgi:hypothetical protein
VTRVAAFLLLAALPAAALARPGSTDACLAKRLDVAAVPAGVGSWQQ